MVRVVGAHAQLVQSAIFHNPGIKYKRLKNAFCITFIALSCVHIFAQLLQLLAQSLIGSPCTLLVGTIRRVQVPRQDLEYTWVGPG